MIGKLVPRPLPSSNITTAALFRVIEATRPTLLVDEADTFLSAREELRGVLNSGHVKGQAFVIRTVGEGANSEVRRFTTWGPKALAAIGGLPDTLADRSIVIALRRRKPDESVEELRADDGRYTDLARRAAKWAEDREEPLSLADPELPAGLHDRAADNWRPLIAIADLLGRAWPERARAAAVALSGEVDDTSAATLLLADLHELFEAHDAEEALWTHDILEALRAREDRPWAEWRNDKPMTPHQLAGLLHGFDIPRTENVRKDNQVKRGYKRTWFKEAWERYLPAEAPPQSATSLHPASQADFSDSQSATAMERVAERKSRKPASQVECSDVADRNPPKRPTLEEEAELEGARKKAAVCPKCQGNIGQPELDGTTTCAKCGRMAA